MPKPRTRKLPVTHIPYEPTPGSTNSLSGPKLIRRFHVLLKLRDQQSAEPTSSSHKLEDVQREIESLGGLERYQRMSVRGQGRERGGGTEKIFIAWLMELGKPGREGKNEQKLRLLEVGAVKPDNYTSHAKWIDCTSIDLQSRHPSIHEQDFMKMSITDNRSAWDAISLSLVINFVPTAKDRGCMLSLAYDFLRDGGLLFLALPLQCVTNSRYFDFDHMRGLMSTIGFQTVKEKWKPWGKMAYWLYKKESGTSTPGGLRRRFEKKIVLREGKSRNNFLVLL